MSPAEIIENGMPVVDDEVLTLLRASAKSFCNDAGFKRVRAQRNTAPGFDRETLNRMAEQGWLGAIIPESHGGQGLPFSAMRVVVEELSKGLMPEPLVATSVHAPMLVWHAGNAAANDAFLPDMATGKVVHAVARGPDLALEKDRDGHRLTGTARHVHPGLGIENFLVIAEYQNQPAIVSVAATATGIAIEPETRADGTFSATVTFENVAIGQGAVIATGDAAARAVRRADSAAFILTGAELLGCMEAAFDLTIDYMKTRVQFDKPIGSFQALQHRAVDLFIQKELSLGVLNEAIAKLDGGADDVSVLMAAHRVKARCSHAGLLIGREAIKLHGAIAFTDEYNAGLYLKRLLSLAALHGNARWHRDRFNDLMQQHGGGLEDDGSDDKGPVDSVFLADDRVDVDWNTFSDQDFRKGVRRYFEENFPTHLRHLGRRGTSAELAEWLGKLARKGWMAPAWPVERGGMGLAPYKQVIFIEERERVGIPRNPDQGVVMFGPMLMSHGTEEQKQKYLPRILTNEYIWCQGYSEPNAGSDLASLRTQAVADGDEFVINGSKIWTTMAHHATHMFLLARTDKTVKKQEGISFFILDLKTPGVTIRPITNIAGNQEFCEVFFEDVRVPKENLVGELNKGWTVAKSLLGFERLNNGSPRRVQGPLGSLAKVARSTGDWASPAFQEKYVSIYLDIADLKSAYSRFSNIVSAGERPGPEISQLKIWAGECAQKLSELVFDTAGEAGGIVGRQQFGGHEIDVLAPFYAMFPSQIASGSNDIQRNILSRRVLGLPK